MLAIWWLTYLARTGLSPAGIIDLARPHTPFFPFFFINTFGRQKRLPTLPGLNFLMKQVAKTWRISI